MRVASPSSPKEKITMHHQITVITQTKAATQMSMEDSKTEQQSDNEKEPEMASGDFLRHRGSRKKLQEDKEDLGHYEQGSMATILCSFQEAFSISQFGNISALNGMHALYSSFILPPELYTHTVPNHSYPLQCQIFAYARAHDHGAKKFPAQGRCSRSPLLRRATQALPSWR
jgi:hypothetical protein